MTENNLLAHLKKFKNKCPEKCFYYKTERCKECITMINDVEEAVLGVAQQIQDALKGELIEELAELEHEQWNTWINFEHINEIDEQLIKDWKKLSQTPYRKLSEDKKESDRFFARKVAKLIEKRMLALLGAKEKEE